MESAYLCRIESAAVCIAGADCVPTACQSHEQQENQSWATVAQHTEEPGTRVVCLSDNLGDLQGQRRGTDTTAAHYLSAAMFR